MGVSSLARVRFSGMDPWVPSKYCHSERARGWSPRQWRIVDGCLWLAVAIHWRRSILWVFPARWITFPQAEAHLWSIWKVRHFPGWTPWKTHKLSLIHISEPTRLRRISYAV